MSLQKINHQYSSQNQELINTILNDVQIAVEQLTIKNRYMNKQQTCTYLKISNNTLDKWIEYGLPFIWIGSTRRFDRVAIDKWLNSRA